LNEKKEKKGENGEMGKWKMVTLYEWKMGGNWNATNR
jgi:hypothetical protein